MSKIKNQLKPIDTPIYGYWSALFKSFFSRRLYVDVGKRWKGLGLLYLLLVLALFTIPLGIKMSMQFNQLFKQQVVDPLLKTPIFYIQNGNVVFDKPMPYVIKNDQGEAVVIIDTTGKVNNFTPEFPYLSILINKKQIAFKVPNPQLSLTKAQALTPKGTPIVQSFDKETNLVFDAKKLVEQNSIAGLKYASQAMIYPVIVSLIFSIFIVFFLVLALLGQTFSSIFFSFKVPFTVASRLLIVSGTPMLLVLLALLTLNALFQGLGIILFALLIAYFCFALFSLRAESRQVVAS